MSKSMARMNSLRRWSLLRWWIPALTWHVPASWHFFFVFTHPGHTWKCKEAAFESVAIRYLSDPDLD